MLKFVKKLTKAQKRNIFLTLDIALIPATYLFVFLVQPVQGGVGQIVAYLPILPYLLVIGIGLSLLLGICSMQLNAYEIGGIRQTVVFSAGLAVSSFLLFSAVGPVLPIGVHVVFGISYFVFSVLSRAILLKIVQAIYRQGHRRCRVLIYGAGSTGTQLVSALRGHECIEPVAFVDDNTALHGLRMSRLPVYGPKDIAGVVATHKIDRVLLAVPSISRPKQIQITRRLQNLDLEVQMLPSFAQLIGEEALLDKLQSVPAQHFLNRVEIQDTLQQDENCYLGRSVMVSGTGGTIGSELCRQLLNCQPAKIVLFELSEHALYQIDRELNQLTLGANVQITPVLGSVVDARQVRQAMEKYSVQVVLHAAAYKHVPLVEANPLAGLVNNVLGTQVLAAEALRAKVERFTLISTDKAVRPTGMMGASKRMAELVVQDMARRATANGGPIFTMVRFGNVLGSSGSVIPLFQDQISKGGPITVTDEKVTRYFMTVHEAVKLVIKTGALALGGEVFVFDMGKPVSILQLAQQVIENAGYTLRDSANPDGDIEIVMTGLRPGEKLTEELTLSKDITATRHAKIFSVREASLSELEIALALRSLRDAAHAGDEDMARAVVNHWLNVFPDPQNKDATRVLALA